ncbi:Aste57867_23973 [Aphanomyces stellatus]|uniref:Aste57867_23973 protein n=1 Tax=Aphanomyces stellatus TaxID=120398 RepID=A0A485LQS2_9STRA|nr:hypothetical protein As57867_023900 [Aphanomyces stellatus]VFU00616.1 Aste57867_23973 [Aphanomyces stellatus]
MSALWPSASVAEWEAVYTTYASVRDALEENLCALETWFQDDLPGLVQDQGLITQVQLSKLMQWKLSKGKWRPRLQSFVDALSDKEVQDLSRKAFAASKKKAYREAIASLSEMKGVGPATASAILAAFDPDVPFMGDEALNAVASEIGARQYTLPHFMRFLAALQSKAQTLNAKGSSTDWTAQKVQVCLWLEAAVEAAPSKKRGAAATAKPAAKKAKRK